MRIHSSTTGAIAGTEAARAKAVHDGFDAIAAAVDYRPDTLVWNIADGQVWTASDKGYATVAYDALILCTGATDRLMPVKGWHYAGAYSLGAAQVALKAQACAIGANVVFMAGRKFGADAKTANEFSGPQYEAFFLYKAAVEKAGSTDSQKVVKALSEVSFDGPRGPVKMDRQRHAALTMRLGQVQPDGSIKILQTFDQVDPGAQCPDLK